MTVFWTITAAMIVVALALLAPTLLRRHAARSDATERFNVEIARERLADLVKEKEAGGLSDEEFAQARQDLELALAQDLEGTAAPAPAARSGGRWALLAAAVLIPLITLPVYLQIGSPHLIESRPGASQAAAGHGASGEMPPVTELVEKLRKRMEQDPDNAEGWFLLGRTYMRLQNYTQAVNAFENVVRLLPDETAGLLSLADAMTMQNDRRVGARAIELLEKALQLDPNSVTALWLLGNAASDRGDNAAALGFWQRAYPLLDAEPAMQNELGQMISQAGGKVPSSLSSLPPIMSAAPQAVAAAPAAPSAAPAAAAAPTETADAEGAAIVVEVALAPFLMEQASPTDTLFVLARAESGPPMPLAVSRQQVSDLPIKVTLTDAMAMMPAMKLSSFPRVKVSARISKSGQAGSKPGDLAAGDVVVESGNPPESVQLLINRVIE
jgi:cytochrome c-type biogenesis protein CcmH